MAYGLKACSCHPLKHIKELFVDVVLLLIETVDRLSKNREEEEEEENTITFRLKCIVIA